jgi:hypothetical protein
MIKILALLSLFFSGVAFGINESERCRVSGDPFAIPAYVPGYLPGQGKDGPLPNVIPLDTGKCVQQNEYRPVLTLANSLTEVPEVFWNQSEGRRYVANVRTLDGWYLASIPMHAVSEMFFLVNIRQMPVLGKRGGHAETRLFFNEPVYLIPQWPLNPLKITETRELVFTGNPTGATAEDRDEPIKNFDGSLLQARGIHTRESRIRQSFIKTWTYTARQYRMKMNPEEIASYIERYIDLADANRLSQHFSLGGLNCNSTQFEVLDHVLRGRYWFPLRPFDPEFAKDRLKERGLIDDNSEVQAFESEQWAQDMLAKYGRHEPPKGKTDDVVGEADRTLE